MAQLVVRNLEESVKRRLKKRADTHGRSLEGEVREILRAAVATSANSKRSTGKGFGTLFHSYFKDIGVDLETRPPEYPRAADFSE